MKARERQSTAGRRAALLGILLAAFALRLVDLALQDIWWDEARNIDVALRPFLAVAIAPELDIHPPIYFWLLHLWSRLMGIEQGMAAGQIAYATRFLSLMAALCGIALLGRLTERTAGASAALIAMAIAAFSPFWLAESQETRMYTLGFALLIAAALPFLTVVQKSAKPSAAASVGRNRFAFVLLSALALLTHYNAVFIVTAWYAWWLWIALRSPRRIAALRRLLTTGLATGVLIAPITPIALRQIPGYTNPNLSVPSLTEYLTQNWQAYFGGYAQSTIAFSQYHVLWYGALLALLIAGLAVASIQRRTGGSEGGAPQGPALSFLLVWLLGGLALYFIAVLDRGAFNVRYSSFVTPALYALLAVALPPSVNAGACSRSPARCCWASGLRSESAPT